MALINGNWALVIGLASVLIVQIASFGITNHFPDADAQLSCTPPPSGLVSWWRAEGNANDAADANHGTLQNGATFSSGKVGQAFNFAGIDQHIRIPDNGNLRLKSFTIDLWFRATSIAGEFPMLVVKEATPVPLNRNYVLYIYHVTGQLGASTSFGGVQRDILSTFSVVDSMWHHAAYVVNDATKRQELYIDGVLAASSTFTNSADVQTANVLIGTNGLFNLGSGGNDFRGQIDEVEIFNRALSLSEIQSIFNADTAGKCTVVATGPILNPVNGHYYQAVRTYGGINWFDANTAAQGRTFSSVPGHLATVNSQLEQDFIVNNFPQVKAPVVSQPAAGFWLGGFQPPGSIEPAGGWRWVTAEGFLYTAWIPGEPNNFQGNQEDGIAYFWFPGATGNGAHWADIPRTGFTPGYVVEYELTNLVFNPANGHYYEAVPTLNGMNWFDAKTAAEGRTHTGFQGHLATITSQQEQDFIVMTLPQVKAPVILHGAGYWLGGFQPLGSTEPAGGWQWITGEPFSFQFWQPSEPNNFGGNEDGLIFWGNPGTNSGDGAKWNDVGRGFAGPGYVVEYEGVLLKVTKIVNSDNGGTLTVSDFPLFIDSNPVTSGVVNIVSIGTHVVSETNQPGYTTTIGGDCAADGTVSLNVGDSKECIITNDDIQPLLTVTKIVINDNGGTAADTDFALSVDSTAVTSGTQTGFNAATYTISETGPSGYSATFSGDCDTAGQITLSVGDVKACTITNDDIQPQLIVIKDVVNNNGGSDSASAFTITVTGTNPVPASFSGAGSPGVTVSLDADSYSISETGPAGYSSSFSADCTGSIAIGEVKTCTITNDDIVIASVFIAEDDDLHVHYHQTNKQGLSYNGYACIKNGKQHTNCKVPLKLGPIGDSRNEEVTIAQKKVYTLNQLLTATGSTGFGQIKSQCGSIFDNSSIVPLATVNEVTAQEVVGVPSIQDYVLIKRVGIYDPGITATYITTVCKHVKADSFNIDSNFDNVADTSKQKLKVMKTVKPAGIQLNPAEEVVLTGSMLEITYPSVALWEEGVNDYVYPYIFTSDSDWSVNVCSYTPEGYVVAGVYDELGNLISATECVQNFVSDETKVIAFEIIDVGSPKKFSVKTEIDAKHNGKSKHSTLNTDTEKVTKDKLVKEKDKGKDKSKDKSKGKGKGNNQGPNAASLEDGFIMLLAAITGLFNSIQSAAVGAVLAGISYLALGRFLFNERKY